MTEKSWLAVEMDESVTLLRKRLEKLNDMRPECVDHETVDEIERIYKAIYYISKISQESNGGSN